MPLSPTGIYTLPNGYLAVTGQDILPSNHNPPLEDIANVLSQAFYRTGVSPMLANLNMNGFKVTNLGFASSNTDAVNYGQLAAVLPRGAIFGLQLSNSVGDTTNDINISSGNASSDDTLTTYMPFPSDMVKRTDAPWAAGSNAGAWLDGASMPDGTGHVFLMQRPDTSATDIGMSASTSPTLPTNYTRKRRIGSIRREAGAIIGFYQQNNLFRRTLPAVVSSATATFPATLTSFLVPAGISVQPIAEFASNVASGASATFQIGSAADGNVIASVSSITGAGGANVNRTILSGGFLTNNSGQMFLGLVASGTVSTALVNALGWIDTRGQ